MADNKPQPAEEAAPAPVQPKPDKKAAVDQAAVAATTSAANANGGRGAQPGGRQDPPLI